MVARKGLTADLRKVSILYCVIFDDCLKKIKIWVKCLIEITWALVKISVLIERKKKRPNPLKVVSKKSNEVLRSYQEMGAAVMEIFPPAAA